MMPLKGLLERLALSWPTCEELLESRRWPRPEMSAGCRTSTAAPTKEAFPSGAQTPRGDGTGLEHSICRGWGSVTSQDPARVSLTEGAAKPATAVSTAVCPATWQVRS